MATILDMPTNLGGGRPAVDAGPEDQAAAVALAESLLGPEPTVEPLAPFGLEDGPPPPASEGAGASEETDDPTDLAPEDEIEDETEMGEPVGAAVQTATDSVAADAGIDDGIRRRLLSAKAECDALESQIEGLREELKDVKKQYDVKVQEVMKIIAGLARDSDRPLLDWAAEHAADRPPAAEAACEEAAADFGQRGEISLVGVAAEADALPPTSCRHLWAREKFPTRVELLRDLGPFEFDDHPEPVSLLAGTTHNCSVVWLSPEEAGGSGGEDWAPQLTIYGGLVELERGPAAAGEYQVVEWADVPPRTKPPSPEADTDAHAAAMRIPLAALIEFGLTEKMVESLAEHRPSLTTLGGLVDYQEAGGRLSDVKGFGEKRLDKLADAMEAFWAAWNSGRRTFVA